MWVVLTNHDIRGKNGNIPELEPKLGRSAGSLGIWALQMAPGERQVSGTEPSPWGSALTLGSYCQDWTIGNPVGVREWENCLVLQWYIWYQKMSHGVGIHWLNILNSWLCTTRFNLERGHLRLSFILKMTAKIVFMVGPYLLLVCISPSQWY